MMQIAGSPAAAGKTELKAAQRTFLLFASAVHSLLCNRSGQQRSLGVAGWMSNDVGPAGQR